MTWIEHYMKTWAGKLLKQVIKEGLGTGTDFDNFSLNMSDWGKLMREIHDAKVLAAKALINEIKKHGPYENIQDAEFKVFSQFGDDGIIQYLMHQLDIKPELFIEFGVENYSEANTKFLLTNNNWKGLIIDGSITNINYIRNDDLYWKYDLTAATAFVTNENINKLFYDNGFSGDIGLLSIDIDGNDYWVWEAIDTVNPIVVIIEYNSHFGDKYAIVTPYNSRFVRSQVHYSNLYWGASLKALCSLGERKGYAFVGCNSAGNNAYFVRADSIGKVRKLSFQEGYVESKFRDSRDSQGRLSYISGTERIKVIKDMPVYDVERGVMVIIRELLDG
jgi:hypothetical protein